MKILAAVLALTVAVAAGAAPRVDIAAASDLVFCLEELNRAYARAQPEVALRVATGSSGNFFAQIRNGAPFDVFFSADMDYPRKLAEAGAADAASLRPYAIGHLVLWTTRKDLDLTPGLAALAGDAVRKLAIANPAHAPYGRAAKAALENAKLWTAVQPKLVLGDNIAQTAQFVQTGHIDAGIVALSLVRAPTLAGVGRHVDVPENLHPPLLQGVILTTRGAKNPAARTYLEFLATPDAREIFDRFGFQPPK